MALANISLRRVAAAGALAVAALTGPGLAALSSPSTTDTATGRCLAWFGAREDGVCRGYSNGSPTYIGTPSVGVWGPGYGNNIPGMNGIGVTTGPLLPGQTINVPIGGQ
jgi:hypothetical protein